MKTQTGTGKSSDSISRWRRQHYAIKFVLIIQAVLLLSACDDQSDQVAVEGWPNYPFQLVPGDPRLDFPTAEGRQLDMDADTWFVEGVLQGQQSSKQYAFVAMFILNFIGEDVPPEDKATVHFYSVAFYDLDNGDYGTYTGYHEEDQPLTALTGYLHLTKTLPGQDASMTTAVDNAGHLKPYTYQANLPGTDHKGRAMSLVLDIQALTNPPVAVGADVHNGKITVYGQDNTYSYFQTGLQLTGTLTWGDITEPVTGTIGHIDRQMFPAYAGVASGPDGRNRAHEWRTFFLDNGLDLSSWRQFDRTQKNLVVPYTGATTYHPHNGAAFVNDLVYEIQSYVRTYQHPVQPLVPPRAEVLYFPDRHRITSASLDLDLQVDPLTKEVPLLALPIEYVHGPVKLSGSLNGQPVQGTGSYERTLGLYRDFELVQVLSDSVTHLDDDEQVIADALVTIAQVETFINNGQSDEAYALADDQLRTQLSRLTTPNDSDMLVILDDLLAVLPEPAAAVNP